MIGGGSKKGSGGFTCKDGGEVLSNPVDAGGGRGTIRLMMMEELRMMLVEMELGVKMEMEGNMRMTKEIRMVVMMMELLIECVSAVMEGRWRNWKMVLLLMMPVLFSSVFQ